MAARPVLLAARGVRKSFRVAERQLEVLHGVDLELLGLVGKSGAGKSTLLHVLGLLDPPTGGQVLLGGVDAWKLGTVERAKLRNTRIGFVFQFYHLLPELDAAENVVLPAMIGRKGLRWRGAMKELRPRAEQLLARFGLGDRLGHKPAQLSGGEQQRVALARALFLDPALVIADEPTGNLDTATGEKVLELLVREQKERGLALLLVTHDERLASRCDRVVVMEDGKVRGSGAAQPPRERIGAERSP